MSPEINLDDLDEAALDAATADLFTSLLGAGRADEVLAAMPAGERALVSEALARHRDRQAAGVAPPSDPAAVAAMQHALARTAPPALPAGGAVTGDEPAPAAEAGTLELARPAAAPAVAFPAAPAPWDEPADIETFAGGLDFGDIDAGGFYWYGRGPEGGFGVQIDNRDDTAEVGLTGTQTRELRDGLAELLAGDRDTLEIIAPARPDAEHMSLVAGAGTVTITRRPDGRYEVSTTADTGAAAATLTPGQLAAAHRQLAADLAAVDEAAATFPGVTGRLADKHPGVRYDNDSALEVAAGTLDDEQAHASGRAVRLYRNSTYRKVRPYLEGRELDSTMDVRERPGQTEPTHEQVSQHVADIDTAMAACPLEQELTTWRGVTDLARALGLPDVDRDLTGHEWTEQSYPSTSLLPEVASNFAPGLPLLRLHVAPGVGAVQLDSRPTERAHNREAEVLLARGLHNRVTGDGTEQVNGRERRVIDVHVSKPGATTTPARPASSPARPTPPPPVAAPAAPTPDPDPEATTVPRPAPYTLTDPDESRNTWGAFGRPAPGVSHFHFDGPLGITIKELGTDRDTPMAGGGTLAEHLAGIATATTFCDLAPQQATDRVRELADALPDGPARRRLEYAWREMGGDAPAYPVDLPEGTPAELVDLARDLAAMPLCRADPSRELEPLREIAEQFTAGRMGRVRLASAVTNLANHRHESKGDHGKVHVDRACRAAGERLRGRR